MKTTSRLAVIAAAGMFMGGFALTPAQAADLGGDCCADLEERVAELEATTVRKGNTKVSLKLSGQVSKSILIWDDGVESDVYVGDNDTSGTRFKLSGSAKVNSGFEVGFYVEYDIQTNELNNLDQETANARGADTIDASDALIYFKGGFGMLRVGRYDDATDGIDAIDLGGTGSATDRSPNDNTLGFLLRTDDGALTTITNGSIVDLDVADGTEIEGVRYDSPTIAGFTVSGSWAAGSDEAGEDEHYAVALRYAQEFGALRLAAGIGFRHENDEDEAWGGSASILHVPSGLNVAYAYGDGESASGVNSESWYVKGGILQKWTSLGATAIYGQYGEASNDGTIDISLVVGDPGTVLDNLETRHWGFGIVQHIDNAATEIFVAYRHFDFNVSCFDFDQIGPCDQGAASASVSDQELDVVEIGARIQF